VAALALADKRVASVVVDVRKTNHRKPRAGVTSAAIASARKGRTDDG
jgi:hypothetical protein